MEHSSGDLNPTDKAGLRTDPRVYRVRAGRGIGTAPGLLSQGVCVSVPKNSKMQDVAADASELVSLPPIHPSLIHFSKAWP